MLHNWADCMPWSCRQWNRIFLFPLPTSSPGTFPPFLGIWANLLTIRGEMGTMVYFRWPNIGLPSRVMFKTALYFRFVIHLLIHMLSTGAGGLGIQLPLISSAIGVFPSILALGVQPHLIQPLEKKNNSNNNGQPSLWTLTRNKLFWEEATGLPWRSDCPKGLGDSAGNFRASDLWNVLLKNIIGSLSAKNGWKPASALDPVKIASAKEENMLT